MKTNLTKPERVFRDIADEGFKQYTLIAGTMGPALIVDFTENQIGNIFICDRNIMVFELLIIPAQKITIHNGYLDDEKLKVFYSEAGFLPDGWVGKDKFRLLKKVFAYYLDKKQIGI